MIVCIYNIYVYAYVHTFIIPTLFIHALPPACPHPLPPDTAPRLSASAGGAARILLDWQILRRGVSQAEVTRLKHQGMCRNGKYSLMIWPS